MNLSKEYLLSPLRSKRKNTEPSIIVGIGCNLKVSQESIQHTIHSPHLQGIELKIVVFNDPEKMISELKNRKITAAVRGTFPAEQTLKILRRTFSLQKIVRLALLETRKGKYGFALGPVGIDEGRTTEERLEIILLGVKFLNRFMGIKRTRVGILSLGRMEDALRDERVASSLKNGENITLLAQNHGISATHYGILIEEAVKQAELVIAPDGPSGNLIFRTLHYLMGGRALGAPVLNIDRIFVDTSRGHTDFVDAVSLAAHLAFNSLNNESSVR